MAEYNNGALPSAPTNEYIYAGGQRIMSVQSGVTDYWHCDHLSPRVRTDSSGNVADQRGAFPYGETWYSPGQSPYMFTTYYRDYESGNDYAMARSYVNRLARFSAMDPLAGDASDPQSLDAYSYGENDPNDLVDSSGLHPALYQDAFTAQSWNQWLFEVFLNSTTFAPGQSADSWAPGNGDILGALIFGPSQLPALFSSIIAPTSEAPPPPCKQGSLNDPNLFWADNFATPEQADAYFQSTNAPASWDGYDAAAKFSAQGLNPGLAVGIMGAETSFGNADLSTKNTNNPFSAFPSKPVSNYGQSLAAGLGTVVRIENATLSDSTPLTALIDQNNSRNIAYEGDAMPARIAWTQNVDSWFRRFAKFIGKCK